jgi:hypothetical protein
MHRIPPLVSGKASARDLTNTALTHTVYQIDPLRDPRWSEFVATHPRASIFHSSAWLDSLRRTYGYQPTAYTTSASNEPLRNAIVACSVNSWLTGRRIVSLPFSDHCDLLADSPVEITALFAALERACVKDGSCYVELRPSCRAEIVTDLFRRDEELYLHKIDLKPDLSTLFQGFHKSSTQRKIKRAEREKLTYQEGRAESLLESFWKLTILTRRRHRLPPQPRRWFRNLADCFGDALKVRIAFKDGLPIAGILTLRHQGTITYKYGCSDVNFHRLGGMHMLFWQTIQDAKTEGLSVFDLGRSNVYNTGLIQFKERWGAKRHSLRYTRFSATPFTSAGSIYDHTGWRPRYAGHLFAYAPDSVLSLLGSLLYKHIG